MRSKGFGQYFFLSILALVLICPNLTQGAGFALFEQSVPGLGNAFAGGSAAADDPSTIFYNPAGMSRLKGHQISLGASAIFPHAEFQDLGSTISPAIPMAGGSPLSGGGDDEGAMSGVLPNLYYSAPIGSRVHAGIGINAPFGLGTEYDNDWVGRYHALKSEAVVLNFNPSAAVRFNKMFSIGAGINIQHFDAELSNAIDFGLLGMGVIPGFMPQSQDGTVNLKADDWGYGFNAGLLFEPLETTRLGISFRSKIDYTLTGRARFTYPNPAAAFLAASPMLNLVDQDARSELTVPESVSLGLYHEFTPQWAIMADATWTNWSRMNELRVTFDGGAPDAVDTLNWDDSWHFATGVTYRPMPNWVLRTGISYDQTAVPNAQLRTPRMPGADRIRVALGVGYQINKWLALDLAYSHTFSDDARINRTGLMPEDLTRGALNGNYELSAEVVALQVKLIF